MHVGRDEEEVDASVERFNNNTVIPDHPEADRADTQARVANGQAIAKRQKVVSSAHGEPLLDGAAALQQD
jgi:hypothetical protein